MVTASDQDIPRRNQWRRLFYNVLLNDRSFGARVDCTETTAIPNIFY